MSIPADEEKWISSPVPKTATRSCMGTNLRRRRLAIVGGSVLAIMVFGGWQLGAIPNVGGVWDGMSDGKSLGNLRIEWGRTDL
jgi:hypothetical protein